MVKRRQTKEEQQSEKKVKMEDKKKQMKVEELEDIAHLMRVQCIEMTESSKSGHPTSCGSLGELMSCLFFSEAGVKVKVSDPGAYENERVVLSKGHAAPILYSVWTQLGYLTQKECLTLRQIDSRIEGHPMPNMSFVDVATGSLGQGLGVGAGIAYADHYLDNNPTKLTVVILGDGEAQEGSVWEAAHFASAYQLNNLLAILDVNKLGQSTQLGNQSLMYKQRFQGFGWTTVVIDGHDVVSIQKALHQSRVNSQKSNGKPMVIIANTLKGKHMGSQVEDNANMHGKPLGVYKQEALDYLHKLIKQPTVRLQPNLASKVEGQEMYKVKNGVQQFQQSQLKEDQLNKATREVYGISLKNLGQPSIDTRQQLVVLDADVKNSTFSIEFMKQYPQRFVECFIAEQNMVSVGLGLSVRDKVVFCSTFAAFLSRAYDQLRMAGVSGANLKICGSHVGCHIGEDGASQMGLEDLAMFRALPGSVVLYPSDSYSMEQAVYIAATTPGIVYIRSNRAALPVLYSPTYRHQIAQSKVFRQSTQDKCLLIAAGVTFHQALSAANTLQSSSICVRLIDLFSVKPIDQQAIIYNAKQANNTIIVVEDHYQQGGIYEAVCAAVSQESTIKVIPMCVNRIPKSGKPQELLELCGISDSHIVQKVLSL